jgi:glycosyltransferase involved in cell wall biosynthesis
MTGPFFSVVMATFKRGQHIRPSIESVLQQTFPDFELLVVGDGCTDETAQAVKAFDSDLISWRNLSENSGSQSAPNNEGLRQARGRWICYLGHDDVWAPDHLQRLREAIEADEALDFVVGGCIYHGPEGSDVYYVTGLFETADAPLRHFFPPSSMAHRRDVSDRIGMWRPPWSIAPPVDCDFLLRAAQAGMRFASTGRITAHKFAAGHRYLSYLRPSSAEQSAMLRSLRDNDVPIERIVETSKRQDFFMTMMNGDYSAQPDGFAFQHNRRNKGLNRPVLRPLLDRTVIEQSDGPRGLDWHVLEHKEVLFRWSGPSPRPRILIPFTGGSARIAIEVLSIPPGSQLGDISIFVEDRKIDYAIEGRAGRPFSLVFEAQLEPSADTIVTLHTPAMFRPSEVLGGEDWRKLGIAVADIIIEPL